MSVDNFIGAVKVKRNEAVEYFMSEDFNQAMANGIETPESVVQKGLDQLVGAILDVVEERYEDIVELVDTAVDDELITMLQITGDLSTLYFEEVSN